MEGPVRGTVSVVKHDPERAKEAEAKISLLRGILQTDMIGQELISF